MEELRAIHRDMRASSNLQLLWAELQIAQTSLDNSNQNRDKLKARFAQLQVDKVTAQGELAEYEEGISKITKPGQDFVDRLNQLKAQLLKVTAQENLPLIV